MIIENIVDWMRDLSPQPSPASPASPAQLPAPSETMWRARTGLAVIVCIVACSVSGCGAVGPPPAAAAHRFPAVCREQPAIPGATWCPTSQSLNTPDLPLLGVCALPHATCCGDGACCPLSHPVCDPAGGGVCANALGDVISATPVPPPPDQRRRMQEKCAIMASKTTVGAVEPSPLAGREESPLHGVELGHALFPSGGVHAPAVQRRTREDPATATLNGQEQWRHKKGRTLFELPTRPSPSEGMDFFSASGFVVRCCNS